MNLTMHARPPSVTFMSPEGGERIDIECGVITMLADTGGYAPDDAGPVFYLTIEQAEELAAELAEVIATTRQLKIAQSATTAKESRK